MNASMSSAPAGLAEKVAHIKLPKCLQMKLEASSIQAKCTQQRTPHNEYPEPGISQTEASVKNQPSIDNGTQDCQNGSKRAEQRDRSTRRAGEYLLGAKVDKSPVKCIEHYLARKDNTNDYYIIKILTRKNVGEKKTLDDVNGDVLLHNEHTILCWLRNEEGVIHSNGMFEETVRQKFTNEKGEVTTKDVRRVCLVLDCYVGHDFSQKYSQITNLQSYVIQQQKLPESEAICLFWKLLRIVERLHKLNIVHRDLKLGNIILNKDSREITLMNFCLGKHLTNENELLVNQRGSPAYISPEVITCKSYSGKPADMWSAGITLYTMLYGAFPFYDTIPKKLFKKIELGEFQIPGDVTVSSKTIQLIRGLLNLDPVKRLTASEAKEKARSIMTGDMPLVPESSFQIVPDCHPDVQRALKRKYSETRLISAGLASDIANALLSKSVENSLNAEGMDPQIKMAKVEASSNLRSLISQFMAEDLGLPATKAKSPDPKEMDRDDA